MNEKRSKVGAWLPLACGPLSLWFDPEGGALRHLCIGGRETLRSVYVALRDRNWGTVTPQLSNLKLQTSETDFQLTFDVECRNGEIDFAWQGSIVGSADGSIAYSMEGVARTDFRRNRIGFCILHPVRECAGQPCRVLHVDGSLEAGDFPELIAPHQPFQNMRAITHGVSTEWELTARFEGDVFEMEDQRNWTDASFKTYCTPLALPFPVLVAAQTRIAQSVFLSLEAAAFEHRLYFSTSSPAQLISQKRMSNARLGRGAGTQKSKVTAVTLLPAAPVPLPPIGLCAAHSETPLANRAYERLGRLRLSHVRIDVDLSASDWPKALAQGLEQAHVLNVQPHIALTLHDNANEQLRALAQFLNTEHPIPNTQYPTPAASSTLLWLIFHAQEKVTSERWVQLTRTHLSPVTPYARFGAGTNAYLAELNRNRPPIGAFDVVCFSINPQVHAFDDVTLAENLEAQAHTVRSARAFCPNVPVFVSPVTLRPRFNPDATSGATKPKTDELPASVDVRQLSLFGAAWTLGSLKTLCEAGADSLTFYETTGWLGVMETEAGTALPALFPSIPGAVFPMYHVFADWGEFAGGHIMPCECNAPLAVTCAVLQRGNRIALLCANLTDGSKVVHLPLPDRTRMTACRRLDATNIEVAAQEPEAFRSSTMCEQTDVCAVSGQFITLNLSPHAYIRIDVEC